MIVWDDQAQADLRAYRLAGLSYRQISLTMGRTRNAVTQAVHRYILGKSPRGGKAYRRDTTRPIGHPKHWSEAYLTERWADRKRRQGRPPEGEATADQRHGA